MRPTCLPIAWSRDVRDGRPLAASLRGEPLVLFRGSDGRLAALVDRCPHRAFPLSRGRVEGGELRCAYHGWRFDPGGACTEVPSLAGPASRPERRADARAAHEADGVAWIGDAEPPRIAWRAGEDALTLRWSFLLRAPLEDAAENILDVPHTAFLHGGLFRRAGGRREIPVRVKRTRDRIEATYAGEPVPAGLLGKLLAPQGGVVTHVDRFVMPSIAQVEYGLGPRLRLVATTWLCPAADRSTRSLHAISVAPRWAAVLAMPVLAPLALWVLRQDARALRRQAENVARFPGRPLVHAETDVLGPHLRQMIERANRGEEPLPDAEWPSRIVT